jgi:hypothetical protein
LFPCPPSLLPRLPSPSPFPLPLPLPRFPIPFLSHTPTPPCTLQRHTPGEQEGPKLLNAFDVVNMFGGMALNRMLSTEDESKVNRSPQFISAAAPREILERIHRSLIAMECEPKVDDVNYKVKATIRTPKGEISIIVNIYALSESLRFVEMHRGKGDLLEYNRWVIPTFLPRE